MHKTTIVTLLEQILQEQKQSNLLLTQQLKLFTPSEYDTPFELDSLPYTDSSQSPSSPPSNEPAFTTIELPPVVLPPFKLLYKPATVGKLSKRVSKVGINDADYRISYKEGLETRTCPYYEKWKGVLRTHFTQPAGQLETGGAVISTKPYRGHKPMPEWLYFSKFRLWYIAYEKANNITPYPTEVVTAVEVVTVDDIMGTTTTSNTTKVLSTTNYTCFTDNYTPLTCPNAYTNGTIAVEPLDSLEYLDATMALMIDSKSLTSSQAALLLQYHSELLREHEVLDHYEEFIGVGMYAQ